MSTMTKIASVTVGAGGAASIDFASVPAIYDDLLLMYSTRTNRAAFYQDQMYCEFNGSATGYTWKQVGNSSGSAISLSAAVPYGGSATAALATASVFSNIGIYIPNYLSSNYKSYAVDGVNESNTASLPYSLGLESGLWSNTAAINRVTLLSETSSTILQYSMATLYGIKNS